MLTIDPSIAILPNVRRMFIPDPGYVIFDADLSGADAQVVAWDADDPDLKAAFRTGVNIHIKNAEDVLGDTWHNATGHHKNLGTERGKLYYDSKRAVHATNYVARPRTVAITLGWSIAKAQSFQSIWFSKHPMILQWHKRIERQLQEPTHCVWNKFGYRRIYFDRADSVLAEALAWIPQSTVAETCFRGALQLRRQCPWVEILLQVHDSLVFQVPEHHADDLSTIRAGLSITIPYDDPLTIPWKLSRSAKSWGDCKEIT